MDDAMTIQPIFFDLLFAVIVFGIGIDFTISGMLIRREYTKHLEKPKLLGLLILRLNQSFFDRMRKQNQIFQFIYSIQCITFFTLSSGILLSVGSLIQIIDILFRLWR